MVPPRRTKLEVKPLQQVKALPPSWTKSQAGKNSRASGQLKRNLNRSRKSPTRTNDANDREIEQQYKRPKCSDTREYERPYSIPRKKLTKSTPDPAIFACSSSSVPASAFVPTVRRSTGATVKTSHNLPLSTSKENIGTNGGNMIAGANHRVERNRNVGTPNIPILHPKRLSGNTQASHSPKANCSDRCKNLRLDPHKVNASHPETEGGADGKLRNEQPHRSNNKTQSSTDSRRMAHGITPKPGDSGIAKGRKAVAKHVSTVTVDDKNHGGASDQDPFITCTKDMIQKCTACEKREEMKKEQKKRAKKIEAATIEIRDAPILCKVNYKKKNKRHTPTLSAKSDDGDDDEEFFPTDKYSSSGSVMDLLNSLDKQKTTPAEERALAAEMELKIVELECEKAKSENERLHLELQEKREVRAHEKDLQNIKHKKELARARREKEKWAAKNESIRMVFDYYCS